MKKIFKSLILVAAAAMGFTACQEELQGEDYANEGTVVVTFVAGTPETKTSVDTSGDVPVFAWDAEESFVVLEQTDALAKATSVDYENADGKAKIDAEFDNNPGHQSYDYVTIYPESAYVSDATSLDEVTLSLPAEQTMVTGSYDPAADLMVSKVVTAAAQPTEAQQVQFTRLAAVAKMTLNGLGDGEQVEKVIFTAEGKYLAGTVTANLATPHEFTVVHGLDKVSVTATSNEVFFTVLPTTLEAGDAYTVTVITDKYLYVKKGVIPAEKSLVFEAGMVTRFGADMAGIVPSDKWVLVKDASTLAEGDIVTIVAKDYDKAISTKLYSNASETSSTAKRGLADVSKFENYLIGGSDVQQLVLVTGTVNGTFSFYDSAREKFLVSSTTGSAYLINQVYCNENTSFAITIDGETASATITNKEGEYSGNLLRYNTNGYFVSNQNSSTVYKDVCLYRIEGAEGDVPVVAANVTVPAADKSVVIAEEGAQEATKIEEVVFNYVGDWTISASSSESWLSVNYADGALTYTAEANTGAKREASVTITASLEGQEALTWTFNVLQKGAPQEISIAEFVTLSKDENSTYKLTGKVVTLATNATSSGYYLADEDGNTAIIVYLDTEDGANVWGHDDIEIKIGDVMTVTTVPMGSKKGGSSSKPSIYKGHYGMKVDSGVAAEYTGGDVTINVTKYSNGRVTVPEVVEGSMEECDYATFSYSGGETAIVSFTSENTTSYAREAVVTFTCGMASATVTVQQGINPANKLGYELVTNASKLAFGDEVIIVAKNADKALACPTKSNDTKLPSTEIEKTGNVIYDIEEAGVQPFKLVEGESDGTMAFEFTYKEETYYPYYSSGLKMRTSINPAASWTITIDEEGEASITTISSSKDYLMKFNSATSSFTAFLSTIDNAIKAENAVGIYKKQTKAPQQ